MSVGLARGIGALDLRVIGNIVISWVVTLPAGVACHVHARFQQGSFRRNVG